MKLIPALDVALFECGTDPDGPQAGRPSASSDPIKPASQGDGFWDVLPSTSHGAGAAMGRRGGAQRNFIDQFVDSWPRCCSLCLPRW